MEDTKLKNFPPINFISIEESEDRRNLLYKKFEEYGLEKITPHIFKRYEEGDYLIESTSEWRKNLGYMGASTSHLKAIKKWYETTSEPYAFFCEDDLSLDTVKYWNFTWQEFFNKLPSSWECVQLLLIRHDMFQYFNPKVHFRHRCFSDWGVAYLITREHAKKLLDNYYCNDVFLFEYKGIDKGCRSDWAADSTLETLLYSVFEDDTVFSFPLFVEDIEFVSTWNKEQETMHYNSSNDIIEWWKREGLNSTLDDLFDIVDILTPKKSIKQKLKNFPPINFISIEESEDRRNLLYKKFEEYGLEKITPHIFKRYEEGDYMFINNPFPGFIGGRGPLTSHLIAIKNWYFNTDEEYAFFCEDDLSLETVKYWNFTWNEFYNSLPEDWGCVQLCWVREDMFAHSRNGVSLRPRCWCDWSACAYLIKRSHAKELISNYYRNGEFNLSYTGKDSHLRPDWALQPIAETIVFSNLSQVYGFPLFVEDVNNCKSAMHYGAFSYANYNSYCLIKDWWMSIGKNISLEKIVNK